MADVEDVPRDLRALARRVPEDIRENCSPLELRLRVEEASALLADAETGDTVKADRSRHRANKLLKACSPGAYRTAMAVLDDQFREAAIRGDDRRAREVQLEIRDFDRRNPQPDPERLLAAAAAAVTRKLSVPTAPRSRIFDRKRRK